jgi:hypothetical protein
MDMKGHKIVFSYPLMWHVLLAQVWTRSQLIFFPKPGFYCVEFLVIKNHLKFNISPILSPNFTIYISLIPTPWDLSNNTKGTSQFFGNSQLWFNLIFN